MRGRQNSSASTLRDESVAYLAVKNPQVQTIDVDSGLMSRNRSVVFRFIARLTVAYIPGRASPIILGKLNFVDVWSILQTCFLFK